MSVNPAVWFPAVRCGTGTDVFTERLVKGLQERGIRCEITWLPHHSEYLPWLRQRPVPPRWANVAHINSWLPKKFIPSKIPVVATIHACVHDASLAPYKNTFQHLYHLTWIRHVEREAIEAADLITSVSHYTACKTAEIFHCTGIQAVLNGTEIPEPPLSKELRNPHTPFRVLYVGNWSLRKGVDLLSPILERLGPDYELQFTADRKGREKTFTIPSNSTNLGRLANKQEMEKVYRQADVLLFPSRLEGLPLTVLEAMAHGLPVVAADCSSLGEVIEHGNNGFLCRKDQVDDFVSAIRNLAGNLQLWRNMGQSAYLTAKNRFNIERMIDSYLTLYRGILQRDFRVGFGKYS